MESYDKRKQEYGLASKETIQALVTSHTESGNTHVPLFLDIRSDAERAESQLESQIPVVHIISTITDTSSLEEQTSCRFILSQ